MTGYAHAGEMVRAFRQRRGLTLEVFARRIKIFDAGRLSKIETGKLPLTANTLADIEVFAGFTDDELSLLWRRAIADDLRRRFGNRGKDFLDRV